MTFGSLFAGIGGMDTGLEWAGMDCVWQVEIESHHRKVLAKLWPDVPKWDDVTTFTGEGFERPDLICGGFPCQDISIAGKGVGIDGARSGLWRDYARIIRIFRPRFVLVENSPALLGRGAGRVFGDLAACGYDAEWDCLPAGAFGTPHLRDRLFIVAHANGAGREKCDFPAVPAQPLLRGWPFDAGVAPDAKGGRKGQLRRIERPEGREKEWNLYRQGFEPPVPRVADGVTNRSHRLIGIGNAVVPQVSEWIGRRIMESGLINTNSRSV